MDPIASAVHAEAAFCAICQSPVATEASTARCPGCGSTYHQECWDENTGCGMYGCAHVPTTEKREELEIPAGHWGKDTKACPSCGKDIVAAAVRCRHCGAAFRTAAPQSAGEFRSTAAAADRLPVLQKRVWWLFAGCAIPFTAAIAGVVGALWYARNRADLRRLPPFALGVVHVALLLAAVQTVALVLVLVIGATALGGA